MQNICTHQKDLDGSQDVHGPSEGGAQVEAQPHGAPKLWTQRAADHEVGTPGCRGKKMKWKEKGDAEKIKEKHDRSVKQKDR